VEDQIKAAKIFEEWKQVSLATAEALRVYMLVKAQVGADQATSEQLKVAKKAVTDNLTATTKLQLEIK
jgi:hypothetical protein